MSEREPEPQGRPWVLAFRFKSSEVARRTYEAVRDAVLTDEAEASVFRFMVGDASFVAVIAEAPLPEERTQEAVELMARHGARAEVPAEIIDRLVERRRAFKSTGLDYFERRGLG